MSNELNIAAISGLTVTFQLYGGGGAVGSPIAATEIGSSGIYTANMPSVAYGLYIVQANAGTANLGSAEIKWSGAFELLESIGNFRGINPNAPWTVTPTQEDAGGEQISITGDGETINTMQKV